MKALDPAASWDRAREASADLREAARHKPSHARGERARPREQRRPPVHQAAPEIDFLAIAGLDPALVMQASAEAKALGVEADAAFLAQRRMGEDEFYRALSRHLGLPFVTHGARLAASVDPYAAARAGVAPLARRPGGPRFVIAPRGGAIAALPKWIDRGAVVLTSPRRFGALLREANEQRIAAEAATTLDGGFAHLSARSFSPRALWPGLAAAFAAAMFLAWLAADAAIVLFDLVLWFVFAGATILRLFTTAASFQRAWPAEKLSDAALPIYTLIIALHREANVIRDLVRALECLDYPRAKLDIKFIIEADDEGTFRALAGAIPGVEYDILIAPAGMPRTKPRALNVALPFARGELAAVFDAEDLPDPGQLRRAAARFLESPRDTACLQARLAIDNAGDGVLQRLYALDYAALFEVTNPGIAALGMPMFLGGSSNHFRVTALNTAGAWDAWNVTEDADLGLRLARLGFRVGALASRTAEEAPPTLRATFRQRTRWMKGWMQTFGVHMRHPQALVRDLGILRAASVVGSFLSGIAGPMIWPVVAALLLRDLLDGSLLSPVGPIAIVRSTLGVFLAVFGTMAMILPIVLGARRQGLASSLWCLALLPLWHLMLFVAGWFALYELFRDPFVWAKTDHGLAKRRRAIAFTP